MLAPTSVGCWPARPCASCSRLDWAWASTVQAWRSARASSVVVESRTQAMLSAEGLAQAPSTSRAVATRKGLRRWDCGMAKRAYSASPVPRLQPGNRAPGLPALVHEALDQRAADILGFALPGEVEAGEAGVAVDLEHPVISGCCGRRRVAQHHVDGRKVELREPAAEILHQPA